MADSIAKMSVLLTSDVSGFSAAMKQVPEEAKSAADGILNALKGAMPGGLGEAFSLGAGIATGTAGIEAVEHAATAAWHSMTELAQEARNVTRESEHLGVSVGFYQQMEMACKRAGIETQQLSGGMERIQRELGNFQAAMHGTEEKNPGDWFRAINLDPMKVALEAPEEQTKQIAEHLLSIQDRATRVNLEMARFGRNGAELEKTFKEIVSGSRPPILSDQEVASLTKFQQTSATMGRELSTATKQLTADLAGAALPWLQTFAAGLHYFIGTEQSAKETQKALEDQAEAARRIGGEMQKAQQAAKALEQAKWHDTMLIAMRQMRDMMQGLGGQLNGTPAWQTELLKLDREHALQGVSWDSRQKFKTEFTEAHQMLDAAALGDRIAQAVQSALKGAESPNEKFFSELRDIARWQAEGRISGQQANALGAKARDELTSAWAREAPRMPGLNERGSQGEYEAITQAMTGQQNLQARLADLQQQAVQAGQQTVDLLTQINSNIGQRPVVGAGG
jgi:hypothetical protein